MTSPGLRSQTASQLRATPHSELGRWEAGVHLESIKRNFPILWMRNQAQKGQVTWSHSKEVLVAASPRLSTLGAGTGVGAVVLFLLFPLICLFFPSLPHAHSFVSKASQVLKVIKKQFIVEESRKGKSREVCAVGLVSFSSEVLSVPSAPLENRQNAALSLESYFSGVR